jgi:transposase
VRSEIAKPYSLDLRQKVIEAIELDGLKKNEVSALFQISRNTIDLWLKRKAATGCLKPIVRTVSPAQGKIQNWEAFRAFAEQHRAKTQAEMAELWTDDVSRRTISRALTRMGWTRKKRPTATASAMRQNGARL